MQTGTIIHRSHDADSNIHGTDHMMQTGTIIHCCIVGDFYIYSVLPTEDVSTQTQERRIHQEQACSHPVVLYA